MDKKVYSAGIIDSNPLSGRPMIGLRQFNFDFLAVTLGGEAFFLLEQDGIATQVTPTGCVYVPAGLRHIYDPAVPEQWRNCWVTFDGNAARQTFAGLLPKPGLTRLKHPGKLKSCWQELASAMLDDRETAVDYAFCMLHNILMEIRLQSISETEQKRSPAVSEAIEIMRSNLRNPELNFESLAQKSKVGIEALRKRFKHETGMPLHQYFLQLKINAAKSMLANPTYRVSDLADFLGFDDQYYFSRLFKKKTGTSPLNYRKSLISKSSR